MFFKRPRHSVFNYQPLFYDEKKELAKKRKAELKTQKDWEYASNIQGEFRHRFQRSAQEGQKKSNIRLLILIAFFGFLAYYLLIHQDLISYMLKYLIPEQP